MRGPSLTLPASTWPRWLCPARPLARRGRFFLRSGGGGIGGDGVGHTSAVLALLVVPDGSNTRVISSALDKRAILWTLSRSHPGFAYSRDLAAPGAPLFSLASSEGSDVVLAGNGVPREIIAWTKSTLEIDPSMTLGGHTGWVRALDVGGTSIFSAACNFVRQWDLRGRERATRRLFTGDVLLVAASGGSLFSSSADGSLRYWSVDPELEEVCVEAGAHSGRIEALACLTSDFVCSGGFDGALKGWRVSDGQLEEAWAMDDAHGGTRVRCLEPIPGGGGVYSGGDDGRVIRWGVYGEQEGVVLHGEGAVRALAAAEGLLVAGFDGGEVVFHEMI